MARPPAQKNVLLWLCTNLTLQTDRTTTFTAYSAELAEAYEWGPYLTSIRPLTITRNRSANFQWKPVVQWSIDGVVFVTPGVDLVASPISANGQVIHPAMSADTFGAPNLRFVLASANTAGTALESAAVTCGLVFTFQT